MVGELDMGLAGMMQFRIANFMQLLMRLQVLGWAKSCLI